MIKLVLTFVLPLCLCACSSSTKMTTRDLVVPENLSVPPGNKLALELHATGVQIYTCQAKKDDPALYEWAFKAPDARLMDDQGRVVGRHYAGPTWESNDGSKVIGKLEQKHDATGAADIPWLLLSAKSNDGSGQFGKVTFIQRVETQAGKAPVTGCDQAHAGQEARVTYEATYRFFVADT